MKDILIGIDAGTSVIKSVAFDGDGRQLAVAALPNVYETLPGGGVEQDATRTWIDTAATLRRLSDMIPNLAERVAAVAVTGQGDGTWLVDEAGAPVGKALLWLDGRAASVVETLRNQPDDRARFELTGTGLAACQQGPQLLWLKQKRHGQVERAATGFHCKDWLYFKMTGVRATDPSEGTFSFGDFRTRDYSDTVVEILGLEGERRLMPEIIDGTNKTHPLSSEAAGITGLLQGTPVVLGYVDVVCTALGAGLYDPTISPGCCIIGSTGMHMRLARDIDDIILNPNSTGYTMALPAPGCFAQIQSNMAATLNIDWVIGLASDILISQGVARNSAELIALVDGWIAAAAPGELLYQPYVSEAGERGPFLNAHARAGFIGISSRHRYGDLVRAVFEGLSFAARDCYDALGSIPEDIRLTGGAARSTALRRILGGVLGANVRTSQREEAGAAGAAMIASVAIGASPSMQACVDTWVTPLLNPPERPDPDLVAVYRRTFPAYVEAHEALRSVWSRLADARTH